MKLSVLMITYNHEPFIAQALESVLMQEVDFPYEIVVGEDCSGDRTREILLEYQQRHPDRIRLLLPERNLGPNRNFAQTYRACCGEYVAILEGDDYWTAPDKLKRQVAYLDAHPGSAICFHPARAVDVQRPETVSFEIRPNRGDAEFTLEDLLRDNIIPTCSVMFRGGLTPELPEWMFTLRQMDWPLHLLNAQHGAIGYLDEFMSVYRVHPGGVWNSVSLPARIGHIVDAYRAINAHFQYRFDGLIQQRILKQTVDLAHALADAGELSRAGEILERIPTEFPGHAEFAAEIAGVRARVSHPTRYRVTRFLKSVLGAGR